MLIRYITHTKKADNCKSVEEITEYKYYKSDDLIKEIYSATKKDFCDKFYSDGSVFTHNLKGEQAECELRISAKNKERFLQTIQNKTTTDNLLTLPSF